MSLAEPVASGALPKGARTPAEDVAEGGGVDLSGVVAAFQRRIWSFLIAFGATLTAVLLFMLLYPPDYTATARVALIQRTIHATPSSDAPVVTQLPPVDPTIPDTEAQVIASRRVAQRVIQMLQLDHDPEFSGLATGWKQKIADLFLVLHPSKYVSPGDQVIDALIGRLTTERFAATAAIDINIKDKDPAKAQKLANAYALAYLQDQVDGKAQRNRQAADALLSQLEALRRQAADDSEKVQAFKIAHNLLNVGSQTITEQEISSENQTLTSARAEAAADQANLRIAQEQLTKGSTGEDVGSALGSPVVASLRAQRAALIGKLADLEGHYGSKYPDLAQVRRSVASLDLEIQAEILRDISNLAAKAQVSQRRVASLEGSIGATKKSLIADNAAIAQLEDLERAATVSQAVYESYLQRFKESLAQLNSITPDAEIVSMAGLPTSPSMPVMWLFLILGLVAGLLFGCFAVLVAELLDDRLNTPANVEHRLHRPFAGGVPLLSSVAPGTSLPVDVVVNRPVSPFTEAVRGVFASVRLAGAGSEPGIVLVTSPHARDGKSTLASCLTRTSALQGLSTVLIDCDAARRGRGLVRDLKIVDRGPGLLEVLKGDADLAQALCRDEASGAWLLPMSEDPERSEELMSGSAMDGLLARLRRDHATVVMDGPSLSIAMARILAAKADTSLIVAPWQESPDGGFLAALKLPPFDQTRRVGIVINRIDATRQTQFGFGPPAGASKALRTHYA